MKHTTLSVAAKSTVAALIIALGLCVGAVQAQPVIQPQVSDGTGVIAPKPLQPQPVESAYELPHNIYGAHLLVNEGKPGSRGDKHLRWARYLVGRWGFAKTLMSGIDKNTRRPQQSWVDYVNRCYELEMIPFCRLGGHFVGKYWKKPEADEPGDYSSMARAVKRVVEGLPRSELCPLYIEIWNEPNLSVEWTGKTNHKEYVAFQIQVAKAIRSIGDDRIKILNGGLASSPEWARMMCNEDPEFADSFDYWSCHPYPMNRPPMFNHHAKNVPPNAELAIDAYMLELAELRKCGRDDIKVVITETGYDLGNSVYTRSEDYPIIDEYNRADYMVRAFRDYWSKWPEVHAVTPFEFSDEGWQRFDWVYPESGVNADGSPTKPHYQYTAVAALAKPTDKTGAINGTVTVAGLGSRLEGVRVGVSGQLFETDPMGNFFLKTLAPGSYRVHAKKDGYKEIEAALEVRRGENTVWNIALDATRRADLKGVVTSSDTSQALDDVEIRLSPGDLKTRTNHSGEYEFKNIVPAKYVLTTELRKHHVYRAGVVEVVAGRINNHSFRLGLDQAPKGDNLANNVGMEAGGGGSGKPGIALGFESPAPADYTDGSAAISSSESHTGQRSQMLSVGLHETSIRQISHYSTVKEGQRFAGSAWIKTECADREAGAWITLDTTNNAGVVVTRLQPKAKVLGRSEGWVFMKLEGVAPAGSERISLNLHTQGGGGHAYFDDAFIGVVESADN